MPMVPLTGGVRSEETPEQYDDQLLDNLNNDKGRMSATKYVAGYMTYKVF